MGFLNLEGLERLWAHIVALVGEKIDNLNLKNGPGNKALQQDGSTATGDHATALGLGTEASGNQSLAAGIMTKATENYGVVVGKYNDTAEGAAVVVGNGNASVARSNAATIDWDGNAWFAGEVSVGENKLPLATEEYVREHSDFLVTLTTTGDDFLSGDVIADKTFIEIYQAFIDGRSVTAFLGAEEGNDNFKLKLGYNIPLMMCSPQWAMFPLTIIEDGLVGSMMIMVDPSDTWTMTVTTTEREPLTFTGAVNTTYDGSEPIEIEIPELVNPDWNENDENSPAYIENRTHYSRGIKTVTIFPEANIAVTSDGETDAGTISTPLSDREEYNIIFNGETYKCTSQTIKMLLDENGQPAPNGTQTLIVNMFGDLSGFGEVPGVDIDLSLSNPDAPFMGMVFLGSIVFLVVTDSSLYNTTATFEITQEVEDIVKLPYKYIHTPDWNAKKGEDGYIENRTHWIEKGAGGDMVLAPTVFGKSNVVIGNTQGGFLTVNPEWLKDIYPEQTYAVTVNGRTDISRALISEDNDVSFIVLGNPNILGTFEPTFGMVNPSPDASWCMLMIAQMALLVYPQLEQAETVTVSIHEESESIYHKLDARFLPETVVQAEPPAKKPGQAILPETELTLYEDNGDKYFGIEGIDITDKIKANSTYIITYNGVAYECVALDVAQFIPDLSHKAFAFGNTEPYGLPGGNPEVPFMISIEGPYGLMALPFEEVESITLTIAELDNTPKQLVYELNGTIRWEDKTHWEEKTGTVILPKTTLEYINDGYDVGGLLITPLSGELVAGEIYTVTYNGVDYKCEAIDAGLVLDGIESGDIILGNSEAFGWGENGNDAPFIVMIYPEPELESGMLVYGFCAIMDGATSITIAISEDNGTIVHKLDAKFLPDSVIMAPSNGEVILPETVVEMVYDQSGNEEVMLITTPLQSKIEKGQEYNVTYNGVSYKCEAIEVPGFPIPVVFMGNLVELGIPTPEKGNLDAPFAMIVLTDNSYSESMEGGYGAIYPLDDPFAVSCTVSIISTAAYKQLVTDYNGNPVWENRTHWIEKAKGELLGERDYLFGDSTQDSFGYYAHLGWLTDKRSDRFNEINELYFEWDNKIYYSKIMQGYIDDNVPAFYFGNLSITEPDLPNLSSTDCQISVVVAPEKPDNIDNDAFLVFAPEFNLEASFRFWKVDEVVHKLDPKYIDLTKTSQPWFPSVDQMVKEGEIYRNEEIVLQAINDKYAVSTITLGLDKVKFNHTSFYTLLADNEEFTAYIERIPQDMDMDNCHILQAYNANTGHYINAIIPDDGFAVFPILESNFLFSTLVIKDEKTYRHKIPASLTAGTSAVRDGTGFGSIQSIHGETQATGQDSIAFGIKAKAYGNRSVAFGYEANANGNDSFALGYFTKAYNNQFVIGYNNLADTESRYSFIIGNNYSNIHALDRSGNAYFTGDVYVQGEGETIGFDGAKKLATEEFVNNAIPSIEGLATETYVNTAVANLVESAPETLNTLNELAAALGDDPNFATTVLNQLSHKADMYVLETEPVNAAVGAFWFDISED